MMLEYQYTTLVVYEIGIGEGYREPDAIKQQYYTLPAPDGDGALKRPAETLSAIRVDLTIKWMHAAQGLLNTFLACDVHTMRKMPNLTYSRTVLGLMVLLKIFFTVKSGALGEFINPDSVKAEDYIEQMTQRLTEASAASKYPIPTRWLLVVGGKSRDWLQRFMKHCTDQEAQQQIQSKAGNNSVGNIGEVAIDSSASTVSGPWQGGIVPVPTPTTYQGMNFPYVRENLALQQQEPPPQVDQLQQSHHFGGYHTIPAVQETMGMAKGPITTTTNVYYPSYSQPAPWVQPTVSPGNEYQIPPQGVWNFQQQQNQQLLDQPNQPFTPVMGSTGNGHDMFPQEMEFDWVPEHGIFQLPTF